MLDLIVIGAGPAGITASVYAARKRMGLLVISRDIGGQAAWSGDIENYTGYQFITGPDLSALRSARLLDVGGFAFGLLLAGRRSVVLDVHANLGFSQFGLHVRRTFGFFGFDALILRGAQYWTTSRWRLVSRNAQTISGFTWSIIFFQSLKMRDALTAGRCPPCCESSSF